jgi:cholesterol transport system auxiliary component
MNKLALILILLWFSGCSSKQVPLKVYTLDAHRVAEVSNSKFKYKTIKVSFPQTLKEKISNKMSYSYSMNDQGNYLNSQWSNNIGKLLQGTIILALDQSRLFKGVLPYESTAGEDYRLESSIFAFSHQIRGEQSHALVSIQCSLINTDTGKLVKTKRFSYRVATKSIDAKGYVEATNEAVSRFTKDLLKWLSI